MRGIVTGATGFLGSHVADHLAEKGHEITVFDSRPTDRHPHVVGDLLDPDALERAFQETDFVCHLAAVGDVYLAAERPALAASVNVTGTTNVCDAALRAGVKRIVVASTWEVYGEPHYQPIDEAHPCAPDHPYNITKYGGELMARSYARLKHLDIVCLRLGTSFGTRMRPNSVFSIFIRKALAGEPITIQGSGLQGRQFTHAKDIGRAFEAALTKGRPGEVYNIVADRMVTIRELAEIVTSFAPTSLTYGEARPGDVRSATVTSAKAAAELGWRAVVRFEDALRELVDEARTMKVSAGPR
ncbi:MAG: NAD-dependent epimerase/dehydratase family protein [Chloroflexota bacterium]|nr:NAD-dependent epimerase/dehydratase family protein [Chloroflexota bacterium]MDE3102056.1 NAD-dependent epimerase/dehydratase family protein [Chloroflexota bacterium]